MKRWKFNQWMLVLSVAVACFGVEAHNNDLPYLWVQNRWIVADGFSTAKQINWRVDLKQKRIVREDAQSQSQSQLPLSQFDFVAAKVSDPNGKIWPQTTWRLASNANEMQILDCGSNAVFLLFRVIVEDPGQAKISNWGVALHELDESPLRDAQIRIRSTLDAGSQAFAGLEYDYAAPFSGSSHTPLAGEQALNMASAGVEVNSNVSGIGNSHVLCADRDVALLNKSLRKTIRQVPALSEVKIVQSWDQSRSTGVFKRKKQKFIEVQLTHTKGRRGWVPENLVILAADCPYFKKPSAALSTKPSTPIGASEPVCCNFPTIDRPTHSYLTAQRRFGAGRSGGRLHAACDLYRRDGEIAQSVADGVVLRGPYRFYQGTYAIEVKHNNFLVRYGEIKGRVPKGIASNRKIKSGQPIGYIGTVNSGCCNPMLHFEMYSGRRSGPLSGGGKYQRRSDLLNPTDKLQVWERMKYGASF